MSKERPGRKLKKRSTKRPAENPLEGQEKTARSAPPNQGPFAQTGFDASHAAQPTALDYLINNLQVQVGNLGDMVLTQANLALQNQQETRNLKQTISTLQEEVANLKQQNSSQEQVIATLQGKVINLEQQNTEKEKKITALQGKVTNLEQQDTEKEKKITALQGKVTNLEQQDTEKEQKITEQGQKIAEQERKITEQGQKITALQKSVDHLSEWVPRAAEAITQHTNGLRRIEKGLYDAGFSLHQHQLFTQSETQDPQMEQSLNSIPGFTEDHQHQPSNQPTITPQEQSSAHSLLLPPAPNIQQNK